MTKPRRDKRGRFISEKAYRRTKAFRNRSRAQKARRAHERKAKAARKGRKKRKEEYVEIEIAVRYRKRRA